MAALVYDFLGIIPILDFLNMKTLNITFTDAEFRELQKFKHKYSNLSWYDFIKRAARCYDKLKGGQEQEHGK